MTSVTALPQQFLMGIVKAYRLLLSPWLGSGCRFEPTCSLYSLQGSHTDFALYWSGTEDLCYHC